MVRGDFMSSIARKVEIYLKAMLERTHNGIIEVQRSTLSEIFDCVPSQINYVLNTRFTPAHGYIVETRRGGGGYVRIVRLNLDTNGRLKALLKEIVGTSIPQNQAEGLIGLLKNEGILTRREALILKNIFSDNVISSTMAKNQDILRARILQSVLVTILREDF